MAKSDSNLEHLFFGQLMADNDIANDVTRQNNMISDIPNHVNILIKFGNFYLKDGSLFKNEACLI